MKTAQLILVLVALTGAFALNQQVFLQNKSKTESKWMNFGSQSSAYLIGVKSNPDLLAYEASQILSEFDYDASSSISKQENELVLSYGAGYFNIPLLTPAETDWLFANYDWDTNNVLTAAEFEQQILFYIDYVLTLRGDSFVQTESNLKKAFSLLQKPFKQDGESESESSSDEMPSEDGESESVHEHHSEHHYDGEYEFELEHIDIKDTIRQLKFLLRERNHDIYEGVAYGVFSLIDFDKSDNINLSEAAIGISYFSGRLHIAPPTFTDIMHVFNTVDSNADQSLDFEEFSHSFHYFLQHAVKELRKERRLRKYAEEHGSESSSEESD